MPQEPIEPTPTIEKGGEAPQEPEKLQEAPPAAPEQSPREAPTAASTTEAPPPEITKEYAGETADLTAQGSSLAFATPDKFTLADILKEPDRIRALGPAEQVNMILDLVVQKKFPVAHDFIERLGKKEDLAFYAWLEDSLHDAATREDWRKFIESQR